MTSTRAPDEHRRIRQPSLADAVVPLVVLVVLIGGSLLLFGLAALDGPIQVALIMSVLVVAVIVLKNGYSWDDVEHAAQGSLASIASAIFILLAVGALIGVWNLSGTIPTLIYVGIKLLSPAWYYAASALICGVISLTIGSSWTTAGTVGVGLVGVASGIGVSTAITAGAVVSGAYLGDKLSPLSETTVLTAQLVKVRVEDHIKRQAWTSLPAFALAFAVLLALSLARNGQVHAPVPTRHRTEENRRHLSHQRLEPAAAAAAGSAVVPQGSRSAGPDGFGAIRRYPRRLPATAGHGGFRRPRDRRCDRLDQRYLAGDGQRVLDPFRYREIDRLLSRGGMHSLLTTIWLIIGAVTFGTLLEHFGLISRLVDPLLRAARSTGRLFVTVFAVAFGLNVFAGDQYIALVLPTRVFRTEFARRGLAPFNLSRLAADSATVTSPLIAWNSCGAYMGAVLGVSAFRYLPFAIFCYASPALSVLYGITGFKIEKTAPAEGNRREAHGLSRD